MSIVKKRCWNKLIVTLTVMSVLISSAAPSMAASASSIIKDSIKVLKAMQKQDDADSMGDIVQDAQAIAVIPSMVKAGLIVGGEYGEGLILRKVNGKWCGPSFYNLGGGSIGLQIGAQKISFILVVNNEDGVNAFLASKTKLGADASIAAGPVGRRGEAATDAQMKASIYSYSMTKGLFAGVSLDGSALSISVKRNKEYWKQEMSAKDALKTEATDSRILPLIEEIEKLAGVKKKADAPQKAFVPLRNDKNS